MADNAESTEFVGRFGSLSREMMAAMLDQSQDCVKILDPVGRIDFMNSNGRCVMEIDDLRTISGKAWDALWPDEAGDQIREAVAEARQGRGARFEAYCPTAKGTPKWWEVTVAPIVGEGGEPFAILATSRDITERQRSRESTETLAHEMRHRLRNAFAVSSAIALASGREEPAHQAFAEGLAARFNSLSLVQSQLIDSGDRQTIAALIHQFVEVFDRGEGHFEVSPIPAVTLDEQQVRLFALILGELSTNSLKHGALEAGLPIAIAVSHDGSTLTLEWRESLPPDPARQSAARVDGHGSGHGLMRRMARAHGGDLDLRFGPESLVARLDLPLV